MTTTGFSPADVFPSGGYDKMSELEMNSVRFDQPPWPKKYVICSTQRSGSFLLCRQLINAGLGAPHEYFNPGHVRMLSHRWNSDPSDLRAYVRRLFAKRTTPNGVWGIKIQWSEYEQVCQSGDGDLLDQEVFDGARYIVLYRKDLPAQAVSLHLSYVTGIWGFDATPTTVPHSAVPLDDLEHVEHCARRIVGETGAWEQFFTRREINPLKMFYEDYAADQSGWLIRVAQVLGVDPTKYRVPPPEPREPQHSPEIEALRRELIARFRVQHPASRLG